MRCVERPLVSPPRRPPLQDKNLMVLHSIVDAIHAKHIYTVTQTLFTNSVAIFITINVAATQPLVALMNNLRFWTFYSNSSIYHKRQTTRNRTSSNTDSIRRKWVRKIHFSANGVNVAHFAEALTKSIWPKRIEASLTSQNGHKNQNLSTKKMPFSDLRQNTRLLHTDMVPNKRARHWSNYQ